MNVVDVFEHKGEFFRVLQDTPRSQVAVMTVSPGRDARPEEVHDADQIIYVVEGQATVRLGDREYKASPGALVMIPAGTRHHVRNPGSVPLFFLTVYAPPEY